jgi:hypothetical protein
MSAAHVRRGGGARAQAKKSSKVAVPKKIAKRLPVDQVGANKIAGLVLGAFILAIALVVLVALDIPAKAERAVAIAIGHAGFKVSGYQIVGINHMNRSLVDQGARSSGRRRRDPPPATPVWLGQGCARLAPPARHPGHRRGRAHPRRFVAERRPPCLDRQ